MQNSPQHPRTHQNGYVYEHIAVMEKMIGRPLREGEVVHHCDGSKANNGPFNLRLFQNRSDHALFHARQKQEGK